jgi:hypothetical protein
MTVEQHLIASEARDLAKAAMSNAWTEDLSKRLDRLFEAIMFRQVLRESPELDKLCDDLISDLELYLTGLDVVRLEDVRAAHGELCALLNRQPDR